MELILPDKLTLDGNIKAYHFSNILDKPTVTLDPTLAKKNANTYTRRDYQTSGVPRIWFYIDIKDAEHFLKTGTNLYSTTIRGNEIIDVNKAIEYYNKDKKTMKVKHPNEFMAVDRFLKNPSNFDILLNNIKKAGFSGLYYIASDIPMIVYLKQIEAKLVK